jgi:predicted TIM-barrel fold metal-dependent hydrolase
VLDCLSREHHPADGNQRVLQLTADSPRLHPAWSALPHSGKDEQPPPDEFLKQMRECRVGALFLFPRQYRFQLSDWCVDAFLEPLAEARVPVFVNYDEIGPQGAGIDGTDWDQVVGLCRRWPQLPVIVSEHRIRRTNRLIYRALDACENLRVELSGLWLHRALEYLTANWGARRLLFGSNWPHLNQACTLVTLTMADLPEEDKRLLAGGNLRELVRWCAPAHPEVELPPPADEFVAVAQSGKRPPDMVFQDCHGHMGGRASHYHLPNCSLDGTVADMDRQGVGKVCIFSFSVVFSDEQFGNDVVADAVRRHPDRFIGFAGLNPHRGKDEMLRELERCETLGLRGVKLIPHYQGFPEEHPLIDVPCQWAHEHKQLILNHHWGSAQQVERLVTTYPDACFVTGHATSAYAEVMKQHRNLYVCSCPVHTPRACESLVDAFGADRLLFGSDLQDLPIAWGLGPILFARLSPEEKRLILGGNLERVLGEYSRP